MKRLNRRLKKDQIERGVIFSSTLSAHTSEQRGDIVHEVYEGDEDREERIRRLKDVVFFEGSHYKYHIIRK